MRYLAGALLILGCASLPSEENIVRSYLSARTHAEVLSYLSDDYRIWFGEQNGPGIPREKVEEMLQWDFSLNPSHRIESLTVDADRVIVVQHEENDFSRLIGFPGWRATSIYWLNDDGKIRAQLYVPAPGQPEWKPYLEKALPWLREHEPAALERIYRGNRLNQTAEAAREWVRVLRAWRAATGQPPVD